MSLPETAGDTRPSLTQERLQVLRYWLRSRNGVIALIGLALVVGAAFNWSWLVAVGVFNYSCRPLVRPDRAHEGGDRR